MDGHQVVETPSLALRPLLGVSLFQKRWASARSL